LESSLQNEKTYLMRIMARLPIAFAVFLAFLGATAPVRAEQLPSSSLGLQISLVTGLSRFELPSEATDFTAAERRRSYVRSGSFPASVSLANLSRSDVTLTYPTAKAAAVRFNFSIVNQDGYVIWDSNYPGSNIGAAQSRLLLAQDVWRRTIQVPLKSSNGQWFPAGRYTLRVEAGQAMATVPFELTVPPLPPGTGIQGQVFVQDLNWVLTTPNPLPPPWQTNGGLVLIPNPRPIPPLSRVAATVTISEVREPNVRYDHPPFSWTGATDADGRFQAATPAGRFFLSAHWEEVNEAESIIATPSRIVTVSLGRFTTQNFAIYGSLIDPNPLVYTVDSAIAEMHGAAGPLIITARGSVNTGGWTNPQLITRPSTEPGVLELDLSATSPAPGSVATPALVPVIVVKNIANTGPWTQVHVHSKTNTVTTAVIMK
jgi:hypothetical protein